MQVKTTAFATTALTVLSLSSAAFANSNTVYLVQDGVDNAASVDQSQATNSQVGGLEGGPSPALQAGDQNTLDVTQTGDFNRVGTQGDGFIQEGTGNQALISQTDGGNLVGQARQTSLNGGGSLSNDIEIHQSGGGAAAISSNEIGSVTQNNTGSGGAANRVFISQIRTDADPDAANAVGAVTQDGSQNLLDVTQYGRNNTINSLSQTNDNNFANVVLDGDGNFIDQLYQGHPAAGFGINNTVDVAIFGNGNGRDADGISPGVLTGDAAIAGVVQGTIGQNGGFNTLGLTINGDNNLFGIYQSGQNNRADTLNVNGYDNQLAVVQLFENNVANVDIQGGDANVVGVRQDTTNFGLAGNTANVTLMGYARENQVSLSQYQPGNVANVMVTGEMNDIDVDQSGGYGTATVNVQSGWNSVSAVQASANSNVDVNVYGGIGYNEVYASQSGGLYNNILVEISGDYNNANGASFFGAAGNVAGMNGLTAGMLTQAGSDNIFEARVGDNGGNASDNLFASLQMGNNNSATLTVTDGSANNQFAMVQTGDGNISNVTQSGFGNSVGILQ